LNVALVDVGLVDAERVDPESSRFAAEAEMEES
jgi:hypothetical protein